VPRSCSCLDLPGVCYRPLASDLIHADLSVAFRRSEPSQAAKSFLRCCTAYRNAHATTPPTA